MTTLNPLSGVHNLDFEDSGFLDSEFDESEYGLFDAGDHAIPDRWYDYADEVSDRMK